MLKMSEANKTRTLGTLNPDIVDIVSPWTTHSVLGCGPAKRHILGARSILCFHGSTLEDMVGETGWRFTGLRLIEEAMDQEISDKELALHCELGVGIWLALLMCHETELGRSADLSSTDLYTNDVEKTFLRRFLSQFGSVSPLGPRAVFDLELTNSILQSTIRIPQSVLSMDWSSRFADDIEPDRGHLRYLMVSWYSLSYSRANR